jgi:phage terminase small subunit
VGEVNPAPRDELLELLAEENPRAHRATLMLYVDSFLDYREAATNIAKHGAIVAHPRTGAPIENPYGKIRATAAGLLLKLGQRLHTDALWIHCPTEDRP